MSDRIHPITLKDAAELICGKRALILCHLNPDGDALGSAFALSEILSLTGGGGRVVTPSPVPERLQFLCGGSDTSYKEKIEEDYELVLTVDTASPSQLGALSFLAEKVAVSFDHHESCTLYSPHVLYSGAAAAGLVIYDLFLELERMGKISGNPAGVLRRIYAAVASDTGSFKFSNTSPEAFSAAAEICRRLQSASGDGEAPLDSMSTSDISVALFDSVSKKDVLTRRLTYKNLRYICGGAVALSTVTAAELAELGLAVDDCGGMVDQVRSIEGTVAGVTLKQSDKSPDLFRGSARANVDFDVSKIAAKLSGGGHKRAAGFKVNAKNLEEAVKIVEECFNEELAQSGASEASECQQNS